MIVKKTVLFVVFALFSVILDAMEVGLCENLTYTHMVPLVSQMDDENCLNFRLVSKTAYQTVNEYRDQCNNIRGITPQWDGLSLNGTLRHYLSQFCVREVVLQGTQRWEHRFSRGQHAIIKKFPAHIDCIVQFVSEGDPQMLGTSICTELLKGRGNIQIIEAPKTIARINTLFDVLRVTNFIDAKYADKWREILTIDPYVCKSDWSSALDCFNNEKWQPSSDHNIDFAKSTFVYDSCRMMLKRSKGVWPYEFNSEFPCSDPLIMALSSCLGDCVRLDKYDRAYEIAVLLMDKLNYLKVLEAALVRAAKFNSSNARDGQILNFVTAFSHFEYADPEKVSCVESFLLKNNVVAYSYLFDLYWKRKMHAKLIDFYLKNKDDACCSQFILGKIDKFVLSSLFCRNIDLAENLIKQIDNKLLNLLMLLFKDIVKNDRDGVERNLDELKVFSQNMHPNRKQFMDFLAALLSRDEMGTISVLEKMKDKQDLFATLIYLKKKNNASYSEMQSLKVAYTEKFGMLYSPYDRDEIGLMVDIVYGNR